MTTPHHDPHVYRDLTPRVLDQQWDVINTRTQRSTLRVWALPMALATTLLLAFGVWWLISTPTTRESVPAPQPQPIASQRTETSPMRTTWPDGSRLALAAHSAVAACEDDLSNPRCVTLRHGVVRFDVDHLPDQPFRVVAADVRIHVVGTQFTVQHRDDRVMVEVHEGVVDVHHRETITRLEANQQWPTPVPIAPPPTPNPQSSPPDDGAPNTPPPDDDVVVSPPPEPDSPAPRTHPTPRTKRRPAPSPPQTTPEDLWRNAKDAARAGQHQDAIDTYRHLTKAHPKHRLVPRALFEIGVIQHSSLRDLPGAVRSFEAYLNHVSITDSFHDDALKRLAEITHDQGHIEQCRTHVAVYLAHHPKGRAAAKLLVLCPP